MSLLGLELSDAGIMVAGADPPRLLEVDGIDTESPGFALADDGHLLVGKAAESNARLQPRLVTNSFWDQLNAEELIQPGFTGRNHAEIACVHLSKIWENVKAFGQELVIAVPPFYSRDQLGLVLGIAAELSVPVKGFVALAIASSPKPLPERTLLHVDIHLHRLVITLLQQGDQLSQEDSLVAEGKGLDHLHGEWVTSIAEEFVRTTRFDPFHQGASEQELYDRLPSVLATFQQNSSVSFEMKAGSTAYRVALTRELFTRKSEAVFREVRRLIGDLLGQPGRSRSPLTLQMTHRITRLPGWNDMLAGMTDTEVIELGPGSGAIGAILLGNQVANQTGHGSVSYLTSRPWPTTKPVSSLAQPTPPSIRSDRVPPTHVLYRNLAYPISDRPLTFGRESRPDGSWIRIRGEGAGVSRKHCSIMRRGEAVVLIDHSTYGTFVDEIRVSETTILQLGQTIRVGTPGEELQLITGVETNET
jgi:hypothetical protein